MEFLESEFLETAQNIDSSEIKERIGFSDPLTSISLFTGAGGFDLGFAQAGFDVRVMVENEENACDTLHLNMERFDDYTKPEILQEDIRDLETQEILEAADLKKGEPTVVYGGPPCQGFSHSNRNRSKDDERNALYLEMVRVVDEAKPVFFIMENVKGLATMDDGEVIKQVCRDFRDCGYNVRWDILDAADYGVPQHRERVFIIGKRVDMLRQPPFGNPQMCIAAATGKIHHPEFFRDKHDLKDPEQTDLGSFSNEPETLEEFLSQTLQKGGFE